jgi:hypothetical protein
MVPLLPRRDREASVRAIFYLISRFMPRKTKPSSGKARDPEEYKRFLEAAKEAGADESPEAFERAFKKVVKSAASRKTGHD